MIYGHEDKKKLFKSLVKKDTLGHAYLFFGEPQIGKFSFACHLAYFIEHRKFEVSKEALIDTVFIKPEEGKKKVGINQIRGMRNFLYQKPLRSRRRLIIINEADYLTPEAQASLLKFVEESPPYITFIFITQDLQSLLPPLVSRLQRVYFSRLPKKKIEEILQKEYNIQRNRAEEIAKKSFGRLGRALNFLNNKKYNKEDLEEFLEENITELFLADKLRNAKLIKWLLTRELKVKRFTLNPKLQRRIIELKSSKGIN